MAAQSLQVATIDIKVCQCKKATLSMQSGKPVGDTLYFCNECDDASIFCDKCGVVLHTLYQHDWMKKNVISINKILKQKANTNDVQWGQLTLSRYLGVKKWLQIAPYIQKAPAFIGNSAAGLTIYYELNNAVTMALKGANFATKNVIKYGGIGIVVASTVEMAYYVRRWWVGDISGLDLCRLFGKTVIRNGLAWVGMKGGMALGAQIGTAISPGIGTAIGIVAGLFLGFAAGMLADKVYDKCVKYDYISETEARRDAVEKALNYFHYNSDDIFNPAIFNKKQLSKKFKNYSLESHPDRTNGSPERFQRLTCHYGILLGLIDKAEAEKKIVIKDTLQIQ